MQARTSWAASVMTLRDDHLPGAHALSTELRWPYREEDWRFALELGQGLGVEDQGRLVATALWWPYDDAFASCGMIIVKASHQGRGIGRNLMDAILRKMNGRTVILNSTLEGRALYDRLGFVPCGEVSQHQAVLAQAPPPLPVEAMRAFSSEDLDAVCALDRRASGMGRAALLGALFNIGKGLVLERDGRIVGYACVRRWGRGVVIGPVVAPKLEQAQALIATLAADHVGDFVRVDVNREDLSRWLDGIGLPRVDRVVSMVRGEPPERAADATLFALSNQSMG